MRILILGDTHLDRRPEESVHPDVFEEIQRASLVVHTGDFVSPAVYRSFYRQSPSMRAVRGNHDADELQDELPAVQRFSAAGQKIVLTHGDQWGRPRPSRLWREFHEEADLVIYGHLHLPMTVRFPGGYVLNPGSATQPRSSHSSYMIASWDEGQKAWDIQTLWLND